MTKRQVIRWAALLGVVLSCTSTTPAETGDARILVFSRTEAFRHASIEPGIASLTQLADEAGFALDATEDGDAFTPANLSRYGAVVFCRPREMSWTSPSRRRSRRSFEAEADS